MEFQTQDQSTKAGSNRSVTEQGYLYIRDCVLTCSGVFEYEASDFQPRMYAERKPEDIIYVYRPPETVEVSADGFSGAAITNDHPPVMLDALNTNKYQTGHVNGTVRAEDDPANPGTKLMIGDLLVTDASQIKLVNEGKEELSNGYYGRYDFTPGTAPDGKRYDCVQLFMRPNHVAIVDAGRSGPLCKVADALPGVTEPKKEELNMSTVTINGVSYEVSEQVAQAVGQLQGELATLKSTMVTPEEHQAVVTARDEAEGQVGELTSQLTEAQAATTPAAMDEAVEERQEVIDRARKLVPNFDHKGKSNDAIRKEVVKAKGGDIANLDSKSKDYIRARFDAMEVPTKDSKTDSELDKQLVNGFANRDSRNNAELPNVDKARADAAKRRQDAWKRQ